MSKDSWPDFHVTKLDAARRNLDMAIRLLFEQADAVPVHTLAHASFGVLKGVAAHRGQTRILEAAKEISPNGEDKLFWKSFNQTGNFLKHGDNDPEGVLSGTPEEENEAVISLAVELYRDLNGEITPEINAFYLWWRCIHFADVDCFTEPFNSWLDENADRLHDEDRHKLLELGNSLLVLLRDTERST